MTNVDGVPCWVCVSPVGPCGVLSGLEAVQAFASSRHMLLQNAPTASGRGSQSKMATMAK